MRYELKCHTCNGTGEVNADDPLTELPCAPRELRDATDENRTCPFCWGKGSRQPLEDRPLENLVLELVNAQTPMEWHEVLRRLKEQCFKPLR